MYFSFKNKEEIRTFLYERKLRDFLPADYPKGIAKRIFFFKHKEMIEESWNIKKDKKKSSKQKYE